MDLILVWGFDWKQFGQGVIACPAALPLARMGWCIAQQLAMGVSALAGSLVFMRVKGALAFMG